MSRLLKLMLLIGASGLHGANLVDNGTLESDQSTSPDNWVVSGKAFEYHRTGGPGGKAMITVKNADSFSLSQRSITLVKGEKYRLSAMIKTSGFSAEKPLLVVHNDGWRIDHGFRKFPENSDWTLIKTAFTAAESRSGIYGLAFNLKNTKGEISIADIKLEAITTKGKENSFSPIGSIKERFLVPLEPCLAKLPHGQKEITLLWAYPVTDKTICEVEINGKKQQNFTINNRQVNIPLKDIVDGENKLSARILNDGNEESKCEFSFGYMPALPPAKGVKRLNNLVQELVSRNISKDEEVSFVNSRDGWIFFAVETGDEVTLALNGDNIPLLTRVGDSREAMRRLKAGEYRVAVNSGTPVKLTVRVIPELFKYPAAYNSYVPGNGKYDWDFHKKYVLDACNVLNGSNILPEHRQEALDRGIEWFSNLGISSDMIRLDSQALTEKMETSPRFTNPAHQGITMDEIFFYRSPNDLIKYAETLRRMKNPDNKSIYTWYVGSPSIPGLHHDLVSSAINVSNGRGIMLFEAYCQPQDSEESAKVFAANKIITAIRQMNAFISGSSSKLGIILGNFNQIPIISLDHRPDVDFKYYLDMQMNLLANNPDCVDLPVIGYWGCQYADEEILRWSFRLLRHYGIEGKTSMLSEQYGYTYQPGLLKNGGFTEGLNHWKINGDVRNDSFEGFGKNSVGLWTGSGGNDFAVLKSGENANSLSQVVEGLVPGKLYSLQFVVADLSEVKENKINPRRLPLKADIGNVEIIKDKSFVYVDSRKETARNKFGRINLHRIVFRAAAPTMNLSFTAQGKPGEELILGHVMMRPYFEN